MTFTTPMPTPSSAPSSSAAGPLAGGYADAVDSPSHYPVSLSQPHASLMHSASIPIAHHQHSNSESRYPLTVPIDFNAPPSPTRQSGVDLDVYASRQRYGSAPSILWSSTRSTYSSYPQQEQEQHIASYQTDAANNQDAVNFFNMNGMMNVNVALDAAGSRLPADSTLLTPPAVFV
ncbi:hypothetical protein ONZ45_g18782 [Pleurotus djamor]|nr:hypothetical protein ONZ45_g18782 [Pleurotus djamor]